MSQLNIENVLFSCLPKNLFIVINNQNKLGEVSTSNSLEIPMFNREWEKEVWIATQQPSFDSTLCAKPEVCKLGYVLPWDTQRFPRGTQARIVWTESISKSLSFLRILS